MFGIPNFSVLNGFTRTAFLAIKDSAINAPTISVRFASKKTGGSTRYQKVKRRPKHRGWRVQDGEVVTPGTILAVQHHLRFHPGLNVGLGRNGTLFAMEQGQVMITCEKVDADWEHTWVKRIYGGREQENIFKKYFNVIPERQHNNFKLLYSI
ncbi:large ribosomal subunit protein bL27m [Hetaerina americana]|uniref:large ribosomal subunit protein bL27m n=1 Tax=Hetaerina americana TaxID=62018 RepID=UPI003A7F37AC